MGALSVLAEKVEKNTEDVGVVTVLKKSKHTAIQVSENNLTFLFFTDLVKTISQKAGKQLLCQCEQVWLTYMVHDFLAAASLVDNSDEVLGEASWDFNNLSIETVIQNYGMCINKIITLGCEHFLVLGSFTYSLINVY